MSFSKEFMAGFEKAAGVSGMPELSEYAEDLVPQINPVVFGRWIEQMNKQAFWGQRALFGTLEKSPKLIEELIAKETQTQAAGHGVSVADKAMQDIATNQVNSQLSRPLTGAEALHYHPGRTIGRGALAVGAGAEVGVTGAQLLTNGKDVPPTTEQAAKMPDAHQQPGFVSRWGPTMAAVGIPAALLAGGYYLTRGQSKKKEEELK